jgi:hypothetical protein
MENTLDVQQSLCRFILFRFKSVADSSVSACCHNWRLIFLFVQSLNPVESNWSLSPLFKMLVVICLFVSISCNFFSSLFFSLEYLLVDMERFLTTQKVVKVRV